MDNLFWSQNSSTTDVFSQQPSNFNFSNNQYNSQNINQNESYITTAKSFIEKFVQSSQYSVENMDQYYQSNSLISFKIHQQSEIKLYECISYHNLRNKLTELGIKQLVYTTSNYTAQPLGKKSTYILIHGMCEINGKKFNFISTVIIRTNGKNQKISNHILEIFI